MKKSIVTAAVVMTLVFAGQSFAQSFSSGGSVPATFGAYNGSYGGYHASTALEGALMGTAALTEAQGRFNRDTAAAAIDIQQARTLSMANDKQYVDTYFQIRDANRKWRAEERGPRATQEDLIRHSKMAAPSRLSRYELDPVFGAITWPTVLQSDRFAAERKLSRRPSAIATRSAAVRTRRFTRKSSR